MEATMHEAKTNLSKLVERALAGEEVILTSGKLHTPMVRLVPVIPPSQESGRPFGLYASQMGEDSDLAALFEPMSEEELALWEGPLTATESDEPHEPRETA
jgi:antitoxin (DNA-binding transcriptional repressor) of toxin-antitoxin stability system